MEGTQPWTFDLCGGHVALDFANTVGERHTSTPIERLSSYGELVSFARQSGIVSDADAGRLQRWAARHAAVAAEIVRGAIELREALYRIFARVTSQERPERPEPSDLEVLNRWLARLRIGDELGWEWSGGADAPDAFLGAVVLEAVELVTSAGLRERVRQCGADDCLFLFLDTSKNRSRRWCDMRQCGNRNKARRHQERLRAER